MNKRHDARQPITEKDILDVSLAHPKGELPYPLNILYDAGVRNLDRLLLGVDVPYAAPWWTRSGRSWRNAQILVLSPKMAEELLLRCPCNKQGKLLLPPGEVHTLKARLPCVLPEICLNSEGRVVQGEVVVATLAVYDRNMPVTVVFNVDKPEEPEEVGPLKRGATPCNLSRRMKRPGQPQKYRSIDEE